MPLDDDFINYMADIDTGDLTWPTDLLLSTVVTVLCNALSLSSVLSLNSMPRNLI